MKAIITEFHPARGMNHQHLTVRCEGHSMVFPYDDAESPLHNHAQAAKAGRALLGEPGPMVGGHFGHQMVWVFAGSSHVIP